MESKSALKVSCVIGVMAVQYFLLYGSLSNPAIIKVEETSKESRNLPRTSQPLETTEVPYITPPNDLSEIVPSSRLTHEQQRMLKAALKKAANETKYILNWYGKQRKDERPWPNEICGRCEFTNDQTMLNHPKTGAVVFMYNHFNLMTLPKSPRKKNQLHVWFTGESPASLYTMRKLHLMHEDRYQFNLTNTYRRDSGIYHPYGNMEEIVSAKWDLGENKNISKILEQKTKLAVVVVSNCNQTSGAKVRIQFIAKMKELGLEIDTFGRCFDENVNETHHEFEGVLKKYKFYIAFENAYHCRDYITEKFFINGFRSGTVPVAWGATKEDYEALAPKDSFIFAEDFSSIRSLVSYLKYLDGDDEAYLGYFKWIERGISSLPMRGRITRYCQLCRQLHGINVDDVYHPSYNASNPERPLFTPNIAHRSVTELRKWYYNTESRDCFEKNPNRIKRFMKFSDFT